MTAFGGFPPETIRFMRQLRANNRKDWFDAHRSDYEAFWVAPAKAFVVAAGQQLAELAPGIRAEPRVLGSIFRINRDTRFARDPSPYKDHLDFWFWEGERRRAVSGFFARLTPEFLGVGAGCHGLDPERLTRFRHAIADPSSGAELAGIAQRLEAVGYELVAPRSSGRRQASPAVAPPGASCSTRHCSSTTMNRSTSASTLARSWAPACGIGAPWRRCTDGSPTTCRPPERPCSDRHGRVLSCSAGRHVAPRRVSWPQRPLRSGRPAPFVQVEAGGNGHAAADGAGDRTTVGVEAQHPFDSCSLGLVGDQPVGHVDPFDHQHLAVQLYLTNRVRLETTASCRDPARLQRTPEGPGQSPGGRGHEIVQRGGVRLGLLRVGAVVLGDGAVDPEGDRSVLGRHRGGPQRALVAGDTNLGAVDDLAHVNLLRPAGGSPWPPPADPATRAHGDVVTQGASLQTRTYHEASRDRAAQ
jgi:uncharacterized protein (TIGR02453 family)